MKKYLIFLLAWALASAFTFATGNDKGEDMIVKIEKGDVSKTVIVRLSNLEKLATEVVVQDAEGGVWYSEWVRREAGYATKMNLKSVPHGDYLLFVRNEAGLWAQAFTMSDNDIAFFEKKSIASDKKGVAVLASFSEGEKGRLIAKFADMGGLNLGLRLANLQEQPATIRIVTLGEGSIYSKVVENENGFVRTLDLTGADNGGYCLYIHTVEATVMQFFTVTGENDVVLGELQRLESGQAVPVHQKAN